MTGISYSAVQSSDWLMRRIDDALITAESNHTNIRRADNDHRNRWKYVGVSSDTLRSWNIDPRDARYLSRSTRACLADQYCFRATNMLTGEVKHHSARCKSPRCPRCAPTRKKINYVRTKHVLDISGMESVFYSVMTLDIVKINKHHDVGPRDTYKWVSWSWDKMMKRIRRLYPDVKYVQTLERQIETQACHTNTLFFSREMMREYCFSPMEFLKWFKRIAKECGFGAQVTMERGRNSDALANYLSDSAGKGDDGTRPNWAGHITKLSQLPYNAPKGTRLLRASHGFLPALNRKKVGPSMFLYEFMKANAQEMDKASEAADKHREVYDLPPSMPLLGDGSEVEPKSDSEPTNAHTVVCGGIEAKQNPADVLDVYRNISPHDGGNMGQGELPICLETYRKHRTVVSVGDMEVDRLGDCVVT